MKGGDGQVDFEKIDDMLRGLAAKVAQLVAAPHEQPETKPRANSTVRVSPNPTSLIAELKRSQAARNPQLSTSPSSTAANSIGAKPRANSAARLPHQPGLAVKQRHRDSDSVTLPPPPTRVRSTVSQLHSAGGSRPLPKPPTTTAKGKGVDKAGGRVARLSQMFIQAGVIGSKGEDGVKKISPETQAQLNKTCEAVADVLPEILGLFFSAINDPSASALQDLKQNVGITEGRTTHAHYSRVALWCYDILRDEKTHSDFYQQLELLPVTLFASGLWLSPSGEFAVADYEKISIEMHTRFPENELIISSAPHTSFKTDIFFWLFAAVAETIGVGSSICQKFTDFCALFGDIDSPDSMNSAPGLKK